MTDRIERLREAAQARHDVTQLRAENALRRLAKRGHAITFQAVAEEAGVSRSWLYRQPELCQEITRLRGSSPARTTSIPSAQRATADSLRQQIQTYRDEITRLRKENQALRDEIARRLGINRADSVTTTSF